LVPGAGRHSVKPFETDVGIATLAGLPAVPIGPRRGTIVALHGGGARARYWDSPVDPEASLLRAGAGPGSTRRKSGGYG
jgi:hypothetical protein